MLGWKQTTTGLRAVAFNPLLRLAFDDAIDPLRAIADMFPQAARQCRKIRSEAPRAPEEGSSGESSNERTPRSRAGAPEGIQSPICMSKSKNRKTYLGWRHLKEKYRDKGPQNW
jgi:hypothetical protein